MRRRDDGSALPLLLVLVLVAVAFVAVAAGATALHLDRLRLLTVADGAALASAESFRVADVRVEGDAVVPRLTGTRVREAAAAAVGAADRGDLVGLRLVDARVSDDGRVATVVVAAVWRPPLAHALLPVEVPVRVESRAAARFG
ncbi:hypothetical protein [Amnibacterium endophyticum]|uniref:Flp pilus-assembly TadG-like N-terminal domain-containing protein n=1 Tax=Amnibacterium endophyticum TaxID=2109337 RepID=A0ABW4LF99_9MICO